MDIVFAFASFAALMIAWTAIERRRLVPRPAPRPVTHVEPSRHGFLRRIA